MSKPAKGNSNMTTIMVALVLCLVCSVLVSAVAVGLKPQQVENQQLDRNKNILMAAGEVDGTANASAVEDKFADFETRIIDLQTGEFMSNEDLTANGIEDAEEYETSLASKIDSLSRDLGDDDPASIGRVPKYAKVYVKEGANDDAEAVVLPVYGYGLWGTIYGFLTIGQDMNTIEGISFYQHKETPGLGALIDEPEWRAQWNGIHAYDENGEVATGVTKGGTSRENWVDGISGATLTSRGVSNFIQFWLGDNGYKPFLDKMRGGEVSKPVDAQAKPVQNKTPVLNTTALGEEA